MALGDSYATLALLKARLASGTGQPLQDTNDDAALTNALSAASRDIEGWCGRQFNTNASATGTGVPVTYTATTLVDTSAAFYAAQIGQVVTSTTNTATISSVTDSTHLIVSTWSPGTPNPGDTYTIPGVVSARVYYPDTLTTVGIDDFATTTGLIVAADYSNAGTYTTIIASTNYQLEPLNGTVDGTTGWPFYRIRAIQTWYPLWYTSIGDPRTSIQITAQWGWPSIPPGIKEACLLLAEETFKLKDAPFGIASFSQYGPVRVRDNPKVEALLERYIKHPLLVA